jgi:hypothetical protein
MHTVLHHHQGANILFSHQVQCARQRLVRVGSEKRAAFDAQDIADFHGIS